jgi:phosphoglycolate phosphatase
VHDALEALAARGHAIGLCTNKPEDSARAILDHFGLMPLFGAVVGGDRLAVVKPDPAPLHLCLSEMGFAAPAGAIFVGDSEVDAATARAAGLPFVLFTEGYRKGPVAALDPAALFDSFASLPAIIASLRA